MHRLICEARERGKGYPKGFPYAERYPLGSVKVKGFARFLFQFSDLDGLIAGFIDGD